jgi:glycosyltransferase involved in cell wall biosynthesis
VLIGVDASRITRPRRTGTENYSLHLLRALLALDARNAYRLYLAAPLGAGLLPHRGGVETRLIARRRLWTHVGLSGEMRRAPPDLLFVPSHVIPLVHPRRTVVVVYDVGHRYVPDAHPPAERLYLEASTRWHVRVATELLTISEAAKRDLVELFGSDPRRISVAYPAVDARFAPAPPDAIARARARHGVRGPYVLHVGTLKPRKNLPRLVRAFAAADLPGDMRLVLAGLDQGGAAAVRRAAAEAGLAARVDLLSHVADEDLPALYSGAACVAIVSLHEGFGMPALEALACGAPLVASRRGSLPEVVGPAGVLVDPLSVASIATGLWRVVSEPAYAAGLRAAGPARARAFTWEDAAAVTLAALERAGRSPTRPAGGTSPRPAAPPVPS